MSTATRGDWQAKKTHEIQCWQLYNMMIDNVNRDMLWLTGEEDAWHPVDLG